MMTKSAQTLFFFALYLFGLGAILVTAPNWFLGLFGFPPTTDVWIRVVGMLVVFVGVYYLVAARANFLPILEVSVKVRIAVMLFFAAFVALGFASPVLLLFGVIDVAGALWTWLALRSELGAPAPKGPAPA
jgi:hypothetical protein